MQRNAIVTKSGKPTPFFWVASKASDPTRQRVYKETAEGVKRLRGIEFNSQSKKLRRV